MGKCGHERPAHVPAKWYRFAEKDMRQCEESALSRGRGKCLESFQIRAHEPMVPRNSGWSLGLLVLVYSLIGIAAALLLGIAASLWPAFQAIRQPIVKNLRN